LRLCDKESVWIVCASDIVSPFMLGPALLLGSLIVTVVLCMYYLPPTAKSCPSSSAASCAADCASSALVSGSGAS
jgi:hypothetical protein